MDATSRMLQILVDGTMKAAVDVLARKKIVVQDYKPVTTAIGEVLQEHLAEYREEWKALVETHMGEPMMRFTVGTQCLSAAIQALERCGLLPEVESG